MSVKYSAPFYFATGPQRQKLNAKIYRMKIYEGYYFRDLQYTLCHCRLQNSFLLNKKMLSTAIYYRGNGVLGNQPDWYRDLSVSGTMATTQLATPPIPPANRIFSGLNCSRLPSHTQTQTHTHSKSTE